MVSVVVVNEEGWQFPSFVSGNSRDRGWLAIKNEKGWSKTKQTQVARDGKELYCISGPRLWEKVGIRHF